MRSGSKLAHGEPINLCRGRYAVLTLPEDVSVEVLCQVVPFQGRACAWLDGVDHAEPALVPLDELLDLAPASTLGQYLRDERHISLGGRFNDLLDLCLSRDLSATVLVRACEFMHGEDMAAIDAVKSAEEWGSILQEMYWAQTDQKSKVDALRSAVAA